MGEDTDGMAESTSKLRDLVKGMTGFDIMKDKAGTQFKDIYDIVVGIGEKWNDLSDINQAALLEKLAGKNQANSLAAALGNISTIQKAYDTAENGSDGSAQKELKNYQKGVEYSIEQMQAKWQEFSNTILSSDAFKSIVDSATGLLSVVTQIVDVGNGIPALLGGAGIAKFISSKD